MTTGIGSDAVALEDLMTLGNGTAGSTIGYSAPAMGPVTFAVTRKSGSAVLGKGAGGSAHALKIYVVKFTDGPIAAGYSSLASQNRFQSSLPN